MDNFNTSRVHIARCRRTSEALGAQVCALVLSLNRPLFNYEGRGIDSGLFPVSWVI